MMTRSLDGRMLSRSEPGRYTGVLCLLLVAATLAAYNPVVRNRFVDFDDADYIVKNPHVQAGLKWSTVKWSFTTFQEGNWHPLTWLSHAVDCQLFHLNPVGHHYTNLLLHAANAVLLFLLLRRATGARWTSWFVAALFALHPINVESVAWAAERKNVLSMFFFLLALLFYERFARSGRRSFYAAVAALFLLGLMAKPQIVTLPFVLLLWDYWPLERMALSGSTSGSGPAVQPSSAWMLVWEKWPLFALAAADSVVTIIAQRAGNTVRTFTQVPLAARLENALVSYVRYLGKALWPSRLAPLYPHPGSSLPLWYVVGALALLLAISALVFRLRDRRYLAMGWFWFLGTLLPMIGIITVGDQAMADRYAYLPFVGLFIAVVWVVSDLASAAKIRPAYLAVSGIVVLGVLSVLTHRQLNHWFDEETLWRYTLTVTDRNYVAHNNLALVLAKEGRVEEAIPHFRAALALHQYPADQVVRLAFYDLRAGHPQEAVEACQAALKSSSDPQVREAALREMGRALLQLGRFDEAEQSYLGALRLRPNDSDALLGSGLLALRAGNINLAVAHFALAAQVDPTDVNLLLLAQALRENGQPAEADRAAAQAHQVSTNFLQAQQAVAQFLALTDLKPF